MGSTTRTPHLPGRDDYSRYPKRVGRSFLAVCRNRLLAYALVSLAVAGSFQIYENSSDRKFQQHVYDNCVQRETIKLEANTRFQLVIADINRMEGDAVVPDVPLLTPVDCSPLHPHK